MPSSLNISSNTSPNCSFSAFFFSSSLFFPKPKLDHGNEFQAPSAFPVLASPWGISSSESKAVEAVEAPDPKPW